MAGKGNGRVAVADMPADLKNKQSPLAAVQAEVRAEQLVDDNGAILVTLTTRNGFVDVRVPPMTEWTSIARHAMQREDDLTWAQQTLTAAEAMKWMSLNPTLGESRQFFEEWGRLLGVSLGE